MSWKNRLLHWARDHKARTLMIVCLSLFIGYLCWPMENLFPDDYSRVVYDTRGRLLRVTLSSDEQVRFPPIETVLPEKYVKAVLYREDRRFYYHPGIDPFAMLKSLYINIRYSERIRGASTITMQVVRLANPNKRTYWVKVLESLRAIKVTLHRSKKEVLQLYASHVPMGGNTVGIKAASYRYFGKHLDNLTWAEAALFAVLPNSPSAINIDSRREQLLQKRNRLLHTLLIEGEIDSMTYELACTESLPNPGQKFPFRAPHFTKFVLDQSEKLELDTHLDLDLQRQVEHIVSGYHRKYMAQGITSMAVLIAETKTGKVRAYLGSPVFMDSAHAGQVDAVQAFRSTGSLLKPYLTALAIQRGPWNMQSKIQDVPTFFGTFAPQNASRTFAGLVTLEEFLIQSLNVPAVRLLNAYGQFDFYRALKNAQFKGLFRSSEEYGLSLILGGAEASLWELTQLFVGLGNMGALTPLSFSRDRLDGRREQLTDPGAAWLVLDALCKLDRPGSEFYWNVFNNQVPVAWKTGTSYGQKDAWAIGVNPQWSIGVWAGNMNGQGNAMLGGANTAGPVLFSLFNRLTKKKKSMWFQKPEYDLVTEEICTVSGYRAGLLCDQTIRVERPFSAFKTQICPFHRRFHVDEKTGYQVCSKCWHQKEVIEVVKMILPPLSQSILRQQGFVVDAVPIHNPHCTAFMATNHIEIIYPVQDIDIVLPRNFQGEYECLVFRASSQRPEQALLWFLDGNILGETTHHHTVTAIPETGPHQLVVQDHDGNTARCRFTVHRM